MALFQLFALVLQTDNSYSSGRVSLLQLASLASSIDIVGGEVSFSPPRDLLFCHRVLTSTVVYNKLQEQIAHILALRSRPQSVCIIVRR